MEYVTLNNGVKMPIVGYGVYQIRDEVECETCVINAINIGYRLIDTAQSYGNERAVGKAIKMSGISRKEMFLTTKIAMRNAGYEKAKASIEESLENLQTDYLDLLIIHQPFNDYYGAYHAMEEAYREGKVRAIGVSNFYPDRFLDLVHFSNVVPAINQLETHVFSQQIESQEIMRKYGTRLEAWGPFAEGKNNFFTNETLVEMGQKYGRSAAQIALRFLTQKGIIVIPKSTHMERMIENFNILDFKLCENDMEIIGGLDRKKNLFYDYHNTEDVEILLNWNKK